MGIEKELSSVRKDVPLAPFTTFKIGGPTRYFYSAKSNEELLEAVRAARAARLPFFILGGGSNLLVSDDGFDGLVIQVKNSKVKIKNEEVNAEAGVSLGKIVNDSIKAGLTGLEWAVGIPGSVGGAIRGNVGAYGHRLSEVVEEVCILDEDGVTRSVPTFARATAGRLVRGCKFRYRSSIFKQKPWVILSARFRLKKGDRSRSREQIAEYVADRCQRIPPYPSAGCVFKNIQSSLCSNSLSRSTSKVVASDLRQGTREMIPEEVIKREMVPAWYLIDQCKLKGKRIGGAQISDKHANFIVNLGGARAGDVVALVKLCKEQVQEKFGAVLEEEICYVGEF